LKSKTERRKIYGSKEKEKRRSEGRDKRKVREKEKVD